MGDFVYIAYSADDAETVADLAEVVMASGWSVCFGRLTEPGNDSTALNSRRMAAAACVLTVWSSNASNSAVVRSDAREALRRQKLVLVTLDDAAPPVTAPIAARLAFGSERDRAEAFSVMQRAIVSHAGPSRRRRGRIMPYAVSNRSAAIELRTPFDLRRLPAITGVTVGAVLLVGSVLLVGAVLVSENLNQTKSVGAALPKPSVNSVGEPGHPPDDASRLTTTPADPAAVQRFVSERPESRAAKAVDSAMRGMEEVAWSNIRADEDVPTMLVALANFRIDYADGKYQSEANALENHCRDTLERVQLLLIVLGFLPQDRGDEVETVRSSVRLFEQSVPIQVSGRITDGLLQRLVAAARGRGPKVPE